MAGVGGPVRISGRRSYLVEFWRWSALVGIDMSGLSDWNDRAGRVKQRPAVVRVMHFCGIE